MARLNRSAFFLPLLLLFNMAVADDTPAALDDNTFAIINGQHISKASYLSTLSSGMRQRFYHGNIPEDQLAAFRKEMAEKIVDSVLLLQEAKRRNIEPDHAAIKQQLDNYERRYGESAHWKSRREQLLPGLKAQLENRDILKRISDELHQVPAPEEAAIERYYNNHPEKFTTPKKNKVSLILLKVDPSSSKSVWDAAREEAAELVSRINAGDSFAALAKLHSGDEASAKNGGDMGYLHQGMLAEEAEEVLAKLEVGELSEPVTTLEGVVILRLDEVSPAVLNPLQKVKDRARDLLQREMSSQLFDDTLKALRKRADMQINIKIAEQDSESD